MKGYSTLGVFFVQSPPTEISLSGRGAASAANSALFVSSLGVLWIGRPLSQLQPPKKCADTITTGTATATRLSTAVSRNV